jgi:hypothetical protein
MKTKQEALQEKSVWKICTPKFKKVSVFKRLTPAGRPIKNDIIEQIEKDLA